MGWALPRTFQQPAYQACADAFSKQNPNVNIKIEQLGWDDYWSGIQTGMVGGTAPDVFTDHLAKFPEFASKNQLLDIQPLVDQDKVDTKQYLPGLADLWVREGKRYGLPKDWDTVAIVYNTDMLKGLDASAFTDEALDPKGTFLFPITNHGSEISTIMTPVMDSIMLGQAKAADALKDANTQVNALFQ